MKEVATASRIGAERIILDRKEQLKNIIIDSSGRPDCLAINLYWDEFRSWHNPKKEYKNGNIIRLPKLHKKGIQDNYKALVEKHGFSKETIRKKIVKLEKLGLISRGFDIETHYGEKLFNRLHIYIWRDTPYFYNPIGVDRKDAGTLKPQTNHKYITAKYGVSNSTNNAGIPLNDRGIGIQPHEDTKLLRTSLKEEKLPLSGVSSFSSSSIITTNSTYSPRTGVSIEYKPKPRICVQAEFSKTSTLVTEQTDLLCYPERAASQPCSTENEYGEIVTKKDELVTICHELNQSGQPETAETSRYRDSDNATFGQSMGITIDTATSAELAHVYQPTVRENRTTKTLQPSYSSRGRHYAPRKTQNPSDSKGMSSLSELLGEMLNSGELFKESELSTESQQLEPQSLTNQGLPLNEYLNKLSEPMPKTIDEETMKAYDWDDPANKLDLAISRNFDSATAQQLTCDIDYCYLAAESKLRLVFKKKLSMSESNKSRLKQIIRDVYGDNTEIVYTLQNVEKDSVAKTARSQEKFSKQTHKAQKYSYESGNSYPDNKPKIPSYEEREKAAKEFYDRQFAQRDKEIELEKQKAQEITKPKETFSPLAIEIFAKRRAEREANNPERNKVNVEEEVKKALMLFEEDQKRKNIPQCQFVGLTESAERPLPHIKVPECWNTNKQKSEEV